MNLSCIPSELGVRSATPTGAETLAGTNPSCDEDAEAQIEESKRRAEAEAQRQAEEERRQREEAETLRQARRREAAEAQRVEAERRQRAEADARQTEEKRREASQQREHPAVMASLRDEPLQHAEYAQQPELPRKSIARPAPAMPRPTTLGQGNTVEQQAASDLLPLRYEGLGKVRWSLPILQAKVKRKTPAEILGNVRVHRQSFKRGTSDNVDCSVFAPTAIRSGAEALIQVFLHVPEDSIVALGIAATADASVDRQITHALNIPIKRGTSVQIFFDPGDLSIPNGVATDQLILWRGQPTSCAFRVRAPRSLLPRNYHPAIRVAVDGMLVGCITFRIRCSLWARPTAPLLAGAAKAYRNAFVSYASKDRYEVLKRTQALRAAITVRQDILDLDPRGAMGVRTL